MNSTHEQPTSAFAGNLLINTRTLVRTSEKLRKIVDQPKKSRDDISVGELSEFLVLLESIITSDQLHYDGTVPASELEKTYAEEEDLERRIDGVNLFSPIIPTNSNSVLELCRSSAIQAAPVLLERILDFEKDFSSAKEKYKEIREIQGRDEDLERFRHSLTAPLGPEDERFSSELPLVELNQFIGSKCVAGIRSIEPSVFPFDAQGELTDVRARAATLVKGCSSEQLRLVVPMLVNAFRANYMNNLGNDWGQAALFAGPDVDYVMDQQVLLLGSYVASRLCRDKLQSELATSEIGKTLKDTEQFPFLGLLSFLSGSESDPYSPFRNAKEDRDKLRAKFFASVGPGERYLHDMSSSDLSSFKEEKLEPIFRKITRRALFNAKVAEFGSMMDRIHSRVVLPAAGIYADASKFVGTFNLLLAKMGLDVGIFDPIGLGQQRDTFADPLIARAEYINAKLQLASEEDPDLARYRAFTHRIEARMKDLLKDASFGELIENRVKEVLGCSLSKK